MPVWANRLYVATGEKQEERDCLTCTYLDGCPNVVDDYIEIRKQLECPENWNMAMSDTLRRVLGRDTQPDNVCFEATFDGNGYYCDRNDLICSQEIPISACCTLPPGDVELYDWKRLSVNVTVPYNQPEARPSLWTRVKEALKCVIKPVT